MADCRKAKNIEIVDLVRRKMRIIISDHVMHGDDEGAEMHLKFFMEGFCWRTDIYCDFKGNGDVFLILPHREPPAVFKWPYYLLNINDEVKTLRKSINRHYAKQGGMFYGRN